MEIDYVGLILLSIWLVFAAYVLFDEDNWDD